jgi:hypothetical protein
MFFWVVMACSVVAGYQHFTVKMEAAWTSETLVYSTTLHDITTQKPLLEKIICFFITGLY